MQIIIIPSVSEPLFQINNSPHIWSIWFNLCLKDYFSFHAKFFSHASYSLRPGAYYHHALSDFGQPGICYQGWRHMATAPYMVISSSWVYLIKSWRRDYITIPGEENISFILPLDDMTCWDRPGWDSPWRWRRGSWEGEPAASPRLSSSSSQWQSAWPTTDPSYVQTPWSQGESEGGRNWLKRQTKV